MEEVHGKNTWNVLLLSAFIYKKQVDLKLGNEELREEIYSMMNWWLDKGIAGFRMDAITYLKKAEGLPLTNQMVRMVWYPYLMEA